MRIFGWSRWWVVAISLPALFALSSVGCLEESSGPSEGPPLYSHDGKWVAFTRARGEKEDIYVARSGEAATPLTEFAHPGFDWSPDGSRIVFVPLNEDFSSRGLFVANRDGSGLRRLTRGEDLWPCWTTDGETIVFRRGHHLRAVGTDGTRGRLLIRNADMPACSPTKPAIAFVATRGWWEGIGIGVLDLRSGSRWMLPRPTDATRYASPSWSPNGHRIAFHVFRPPLPSDPEFEHRSTFADGYWYLTEIYVTDADGSGLERLTRNTVGDAQPTWLPDGRILFESNRAGPSDFTNSDAFHYYLMNRDGTGVERFLWNPKYS
jgi:Tol biopolymer transport system component